MCGEEGKRLNYTVLPWNFLWIIDMKTILFVIKFQNFFDVISEWRIIGLKMCSSAYISEIFISGWI